METAFAEVLGRLVARAPGRPAVTCGGRTLSRADLESLSNRLARAFADRGVGTGDHVSIALDNSVGFFVATVASWKLGAIPQPLPARTPPAERDALLALVKPAGVVGAEAAGHPALPAEAPEQDDGPLPIAVSPAWKATGSGGSTGRPKVIVASTPAVAELVLPTAALLQMPHESTVLVPGPLHHNAPFLFASLGLLAGSHVVLQQRFDAARLLHDLAAYGAAWVYLVPTMMQRIWKLEPDVRDGHDLSSLERVVHMAAPCPPWLKRAWIDWLGPERILEVYSATEGVAATRIDGKDWLRHPGSVGRPVIGEFKILDAAEREAPAGETGRVWMRRGPGAPASYRDLGADSRPIEGGWECLGDMGYIDADGYLFLTDRDSDMIITGGANVYPAEIEAALDEHPGVLTSCVIGMPHTDLGAVPHAIVQTSVPLSAEDLTEFLRQRISAYKLPRTFEVTEAPLRDDAGKVRRGALRAERLRRHAGERR
jgi:bile acid-coenzyme A ligase